MQIGTHYPDLDLPKAPGTHPLRATGPVSLSMRTKNSAESFGHSPYWNHGSTSSK
jgi:hypothetical protein